MQTGPSFPSANVPSITVDGNVYLSDRFYLLRPDDDPMSPQDESCKCGAHGPPPLLDKSRLLASLDLRAAILGSYTVDINFVRQELPTLFGGVPTLVVHGHKGLKKRIEDASRKGGKKITQMNFSESNESLSKRARITSEQENVVVLDSSDDDDDDNFQCSAGLGDDAPSAAAIKKEDETPPEEGWLNEDGELSDNDGLPCDLPHNFHLTQILPTWLPPDAPVHSSWCTKEQTKAKLPAHLIVIDSDDELERKGVDPGIVKARVQKRGVHHPKFMILFERSGSVIVMVTTSNLTKQTSVDGAWIQRFEPADKMAKRRDTNVRADGSDFGYVLADFLHHESNAASEGDLLPEEFLYKYCGLDGLDNFRRHYQFQDSQVHLIAHVPGDHPGRHTSTHLGKNGNGRQRNLLYGPQRVADVVERLSHSCKHGEAWIPEKFLSDKDRFIVQTTSFGGYWTRENMTHLIKSYFGRERHGTSLEGGCDFALLNQTDIIWPTMKFMRTIHDRLQAARSPSPESVLELDTEISKPVSAKDEVVSSGFVFLSSEAFNTIDFPCISRMSTYEPSSPNQITPWRAPHFKSYLRLLESNREKLCQNYGKAAENLSWFLLTSACLSRGAQGTPTRMRSLESDETTYSNFELGVLFCSRLQGDRKSDRLYCSRPFECACGKLAKSQNLIHLPIPYSLRTKSYQPDQDEADFLFTPYFHEIPQGTGCVGQMKLTPLGAELAAETKKISSVQLEMTRR